MCNQPIGNHGLGIFDVVRFDLWPFLRGQMRIAKSKVLINRFIFCLLSVSTSCSHKHLGPLPTGVYLCQP